MSTRSMGPIHIGSVIHPHNADEVGLVVDLVDDPIWSSTSCPQARQFTSQGMSNSSGRLEESASHELDHSCSCLLRQPS